MCIELEEQVEELQIQLKSFHGWEAERGALLQCLSVTKEQIQELMEEVVTLQLEKDELEEEKKEFFEGVKPLEENKLSNEIEHLKKELAKKETNWKLQEDNLQDKIVALESERAIARAREDGLEEKLQAARETICGLELCVAARTKDSHLASQDLEEYRKSEADKDNQISSLQKVLANTKNQLANTNAERDIVRKDAQEWKGRFDNAECRLNESHSKIKDLETKLAEQETKITTARQSSSRDAEEKMFSLEKENTMLNQQLKEYRKRVEDKEKDFAAKDRDLSDANTTLEDKLHESQLLNKDLERELSEKVKELLDMRNLLSTQESDRKTLEAEFQKARTNLELKDDEIRELRLIELKDYEDEVNDLKKKVKSKDDEIKSLIEKLEGFSVGQLEREVEFAEEINSLKTTIAALKEENQVSDSARLTASQELEASKTSLQRRNQLLEKTVKSLRQEKDLILASESSNECEMQKLEMALHREISIREKTSNELSASQTRIQSLEEAVAALETQKTETEKLLNERTDLLSQMVEVNKSLQSTVDSSLVNKEQVEKLEEQKAALFDAMNREQSIREVLEAELKSMHSQISTMKKEAHDNERLKAENAELHSKIKRQEAFLKKKIHKEKVMRERSLMGTPARGLGSPRKARSAVKNRSYSLEESFSENLDPNMHFIP